MRKISLLALAAGLLASPLASAQNARWADGRLAQPGAPPRNLEKPLYNPAKGVFYSKTNFNFTPVKDYDDSLSVAEEFGYGLTDRWTISASLGYGWMDKDLSLGGDASGLSNLGLGVLYKPLDRDGLVWTLKSGFVLDAGDKMAGQYPLGLPIADMGKDDSTFDLSTMLGYEFGGGLVLAAEVGYMLDLDDEEDYADYKLGDTSLYFANVAGQLALGDRWSVNLAYKYKGTTKDFMGQKKVGASDIVLGANWQARESALLTAYANYDASGKEDRTYMVAHSGADGGDNRWSFGLRAGVQF
jgi:hypothetical protein